MQRSPFPINIQWLCPWFSSNVHEPSRPSSAAGSVRLGAGNHELAVEFTNDAWLGQGREERNLYITGVGFLATD